MGAGSVTIATTAITSVGNLFTRAISAYENCKRIDFEMTQLRTKRELALKVAELKKLEQKLELEKSEKEFDRICKQLEGQLSSFKIDRQEYLKRQKHWQVQSDRILDAIINGGGDDAKLEKLKNMWETLQAKIENAARDENIAVLNFPNSAKQLFEAHNARMGFSVQQQIGLKGGI